MIGGMHGECGKRRGSIEGNCSRGLTASGHYMLRVCIIGEGRMERDRGHVRWRGFQKEAGVRVPH